MNPPIWFPTWIVAILGVALPWVYQAFLRRLPGWLKFVISYALSAGVVLLLSVTVLKLGNLEAWLAALGTLWAAVQFVYSLLVKPVARSADRRRKRKTQVR